MGFTGSRILMAWSICFLTSISTITESNGKQLKPIKYILELPTCKIPEVPLDNDAIAPEWNITMNPVAELSLTDYAKKMYTKCCYTQILRPEILVSDKYNLSVCMRFPKSKTMVLPPEDEYGYVSCIPKRSTAQKLKDKDKKPTPRMKFHSQLRIKPRITPKLEYWKQFKGQEKPISILIIILDSISRTHAFRGAPKTMKFILEEMKFLDFKAFHVLGEPTIENEVPLMLGTVTSDWEMKKPHYKGKYDDRPFIWQNFSAANYVTMDNEDGPLWHTFNFNGRKGFTKQPFDYYLRPYYLAQENLNGETAKKVMKIVHTQRKTGTVDFNYTPLVCAESKPIYDFLFDKAWKFLNVINPKETPSFSLHFLTWPNHDYLPSMRWLDEPVLNLMQKIKKTPDIYDNTFIVLMGDHGLRWANYSDTEEGLLERDLPMLSIRLPERFVAKYPEMAKNMKENTERVTSHPDLFKTFAQLHKLGLPEDHPEKNNSHYGYNRAYGISLFDKIPIDRKCADIKVSDQFCACNYPLYSDEFDYNKYSKEKAIEGISAVTDG